MSRPSRSAFVTVRPDTPPPDVYCPECAYPLVYRDTVLTGVRSQPERYDRFSCRRHGPFEYRHRTRLLRPFIES